MTETTTVASLAEIMRHLAADFDASMPEPSGFTVYTYDDRSPIVGLTFDVEGAACVETWTAKYGSTHVTQQPVNDGTKWLTTDGFQLMGMSVQLTGYDPRETEPAAAVEQDAKTIVAEALRPNPLAELLPDTGGWDDDTSRCARCGTAFSPSWATHCVPCDGPMRVVSGGASKLRTFEDAHGCTWRENGEWLTLLDADGKDSGLNKTRAFVQQHYGPLREVTP